jgi:cation:H+ antiporter
MSIIIWLLFGTSVVLVLYGGVQLTRSGDMIAEKTGIGRAWIGLVIIAFATTLPELVTSISAICLVEEPDLAAGNCFGSMAFNLLLVTFIDLFGGRISLRGEMNRGLLLSGGLFIVLLFIVQFSIFSWRFYPIASFSIWKSDLTSFFIIIIYFLTTRMIFTFGKAAGSSTETIVKPEYDEYTLGKSFFLYGFSIFFVLVGGILLAETANRIAVETGIGQTFVGSTLVGITTSLPEMVVAFTAVRLGALEMVVGNVLGANLFNLIIVALCDFLYREGILLKSIDLNHSITIVMVVIMTGVVLLGQYYHSKRKVLRLGWDSISLFFIYIIGVTLLYNLKGL